ncbi:Hydrogenase 2 maturation peptidase [Thaumarchaeota archaeon SCGC AB-539-E09]|uniref:Hydrogenase 2 maturation peptidase n=2 Tax=Thaumarchaeota archaeon SCGC AB-539-E09 TaxID=1198115 RepID=A0ACD6B9S0_9ARCH|nr:Hydrogenase 2 maturation peptidase [Thaumarchaeota archaeon SCGC AB-539-E09]
MSAGKRVLVAGVGNRLMGDDGFGPRVVDLLSSMSLPDYVDARDIGTAGITVATDLEDYEKVIFLDSVELEGPPGRLSKSILEVRGLDEDISQLARMTLHEVGLEGLLKFAKSIGVLPGEVTLIGCIPRSLKPSLELSEEVEAATHAAVDLVLEALGLE